jgi:hypothetical protein
MCSHGVAAQVEIEKHSLKAVHHILVPSAATRRAFNTGFDTVNLHRLTTESQARTHATASEWYRLQLRYVAAQAEIVSKTDVESSLTYYAFKRGNHRCFQARKPQVLSTRGLILSTCTARPPPSSALSWSSWRGGPLRTTTTPISEHGLHSVRNSVTVRVLILEHTCGGSRGNSMSTVHIVLP